MSLQPYALTTIAEYKDTLGVGGGAKDDVIERAINTASRLIESELGRRLRYRAPEEVEGGANVVASVALANGALTIAAQPSASRTLILTVTDADRSIRTGTVTVTGTVGGVASQTESFNLADGQSRYHGRKFFTVIASIVVSSLTGSGTADTIAVGTSLGMVEYHTPECGAARIRLLETPVYALAEVNEDFNRTYGSTTALDSGDYEYGADGCMTRVVSSWPFPFWGGYRSIKVRYSAGYGAISSLPPDLRDLCVRLAGAKVQEFQRGALGTTSVSDQLGNFSRVAATLTRDQRDELAAYRRPDIFSTTAERDFDLEAV